MRYDFDDLNHQDHLAPSDIRPPMNYANGGMVTAPMTNVLNTQNQMNLMSRPTGSFSGMSSQLNTNPSPAAMAQNQATQGLPQYQPRSYQPLGISTPTQSSVPPQTSLRMNPYDQGAMLSQKQPENFPAQPFQAQPINQPMFQPLQQQQPQVVQVDQVDENQNQSPLAMAKGGSVTQGADRLIAQIRKKFAEQGIDFDKIMAMRLQHMGQKGDTMLAHINPDEAKMLKEHGGSGKINPHTGLLSFGVDDGPERGSTGSASGASYGGGSSTGSGGGSNQSANAAMGSESPAARDVSYTGGNDSRDSSDRSNNGSASARQQAERNIANAAAAQKAADVAANAARIATERAYNETPSFLSQIGTGLNQLIGITPAQAGTASAAARAKQAEADAALKAVAEAKLAGVTGGVPLGFKSPQTIAREANLAENQAQAAIDAANLRSGFATGLTPMASFTGQAPTTTTFGSGIVPAGVFTGQQMSMPGVRSPEQMQEATRERTIPEIIASMVNPTGESLKYESKYSLPDVGLRIGTQGTPAITTESKSPFQSVVDAITAETVAPLAVNNLPRATVNPLSPAAIRAAQDNSMSKLAAAQAAAAASPNLFDEYNANAPVTNVPLPVRRPADLNPPVDHPVPPADIPSEMPSEEMVTTIPPLTGFPKVPPMPPIPYRDLGEGNILDMFLKPFGLDTESWINNKAAEYEKQGLSPSDAAIRASYDLRDVQAGLKRGGGENTPVPPLAKPKKPIKKPPTDEEKDKTKEPFRTFYQPNIDYSTYGLGGGEASFYKAKGGAVSPLKAVKKHG